MNINRLVKHLFSGRYQVRKLFSTEAFDRITATIAKIESTHNGEIRFAIEAGLHWQQVLRGVTSRLRAISVFSELRVWDTEANNGVLIYLLLADRQVEILADRGVNAKVGAEGWNTICNRMEKEFRAGKFEQGIIFGVEAVGQHLSLHYPHQGENKNELPDRPVVL